MPSYRNGYAELRRVTPSYENRQLERLSQILGPMTWVFSRSIDFSHRLTFPPNFMFCTKSEHWLDYCCLVALPQTPSHSANTFAFCSEAFCFWSKVGPPGPSPDRRYLPDTTDRSDMPMDTHRNSHASGLSDLMLLQVLWDQTAMHPTRRSILRGWGSVCY